MVENGAKKIVEMIHDNLNQDEGSMRYHIRLLQSMVEAAEGIRQLAEKHRLKPKHGTFYINSFAASSQKDPSRILSFDLSLRIDGIECGTLRVSSSRGLVFSVTDGNYAEFRKIWGSLFGSNNSCEWNERVESYAKKCQEKRDQDREHKLDTLDKPEALVESRFIEMHREKIGARKANALKRHQPILYPPGKKNAYEWFPLQFRSPIAGLSGKISTPGGLVDIVGIDASPPPPFALEIIEVKKWDPNESIAEVFQQAIYYSAAIQYMLHKSDYCEAMGALVGHSLTSNTRVQASIGVSYSDNSYDETLKALDALVSEGSPIWLKAYLFDKNMLLKDGQIEIVKVASRIPS